MLDYLASPSAKVFFERNDHEGRQVAESLLIQMYLRNALGAHSSASSIWFTELENLLQQLQALKVRDAEASIYKHRGCSAMGLWHRLHDQPGMAKRWLRELVLEGLQMFTDTDPDNDVWGYLNLGRALLTFGDSKNASIAFAVAGSPPPDSGEKMWQQDREDTAILVKDINNNKT